MKNNLVIIYHFVFVCVLPTGREGDIGLVVMEIVCSTNSVVGNEEEGLLYRLFVQPTRWGGVGEGSMGLYVHRNC